MTDHEDIRKALDALNETEFTVRCYAVDHLTWHAPQWLAGLLAECDGLRARVAMLDSLLAPLQAAAQHAVADLDFALVGMRLADALPLMREAHDEALARAELAESKRLRDEALRTFRAREDAIERAEKRALTAESERDDLQRHYDASGPEHNLLALLDLYHERKMESEEERDAARDRAVTAERERDGLQGEIDVLIDRLRRAEEQRDARPDIKPAQARGWLSERHDADGPSENWNAVVLALRAHASHPKCSACHGTRVVMDADHDSRVLTATDCPECSQPKGDAHAGRELLAWGETLSNETKATLLERVDPLHPDGKCQCAGEGLCEWCVRVGICDSDITKRAATDREIVRVVRDWWDSPTAYDSDLIKRVSTLLTKEGEGTR